MIKDIITQVKEIDKNILELFKERKILLNNSKNVEFYSYNKEFIKSIEEEIFSIVKIEYDNEKIVYLGPEGSYTQEAAINNFGIDNLYYSVNSIKNIFYEIDENRATYGVVPIENSSNGIVGDTINCFNSYDLNIIGETILDIHHTLVSNCNKIEDIKIIYSKDIAFDQCSIFLENYHLNEIKYEYVDSTTKAAKLASLTPNSAAICSELAAKTSNIPILFNNIEDNKDNKTRFFIISKKTTKKTKNDKTSIIVQLPNKYGCLIDFLNDFKENKINLNKIKSHIVKGISTFFIEFDGHKDDSNVKKILTKHNNNIKVLGSYKKEIEDI
ncbi:prephenate dehydratase [Aliarcobacter cibarius]|uniref:prephenate dehydratase n=1 Tax=Aliarcobacter cibarius TaxID=255507 RepID=A0A7L5JM33_9BACT|nr:prephenate dehydratase domain-containing protein [Aliarcobacter cibarius]QKJ26232.1 prephenate dehydratase [Aliarcobacter cibarius]